MLLHIYAEIHPMETENSWLIRLYQKSNRNCIASILVMEVAVVHFDVHMLQKKLLKCVQVYLVY